MIAVAGDVVGLVIAASAVVVTALGVFLGIPAWRTQRHALATQEQSERNAEMMRVVKEVLTGTGPVVARDPDHPSMTDLLADIRENTSEVAWLAAAFGRHVADGHGRYPAQPGRPRPRG